MKPPALLFALVLTFSAVAEERYVPIASGTELQLTNPAARRAGVTIEVLGGNVTHVEIEPGETLRWSAPADEGVLRIEGAVQIAASSQRESARTLLPVVAARETVDEAVIPRRRAPWRSGVLAINPGEATAVVTIDGELHTIGPRGVLRVEGGSVVRSRMPLLLFASDFNQASGARVFTPVAPHAQTRKRRAVRSGPPAAPATQTVVLTPSKDNTLYDSSTGNASNGAGAFLFIGRTRSFGSRRALLAFDVAGQVPPGSRITRASLRINVSQGSGTLATALHRVTKDWGEGRSNAGSPGGGGTEPATGDATWIHTFSPNSRWTRAGGDFETTADATTAVEQTGTWENAAMVTRVQQWLDQPATNFGWIVIGNETSPGNAKRLNAREHGNTPTRPSLTIEFQR